MKIEQAIEIPLNHFTSASVNKDLESAEAIWAANRAHPEELRNKLQALPGCLGKDAFGDMDGVAYQRKVREKWDN